MEEALATTEDGRRRLAEAEERTDQKLAKQIEESDVRPEGGIEGAQENHGPDIVPGDFDEVPQAPLLQPSHERTSIDEWIDDGAEDMEFENGHMAPQSPMQADDDDYSPTTPRGSDSEAGMDTGMVELLKVCSGSEDIRRAVKRDAEEILKLVRDLGGSRNAYKKERAKAVKAIVADIYSPPRITKAIKMMPSSKVIAGFALDLTTCDEDGRAWNSDEEEMRQRAKENMATEKLCFLIGSPFCTPYSPLQALSAARRYP
jgi:hypothetical protein